MPTFSSPNSFKDIKGYVPLLKKALQTVKPETQKKFLFYKQYAFGPKKLPLVLVDYDMNFPAALAKTGLKPAAEGLVSLTPQDELNFEPKKGSLKRIRIKKYLATIGGGFKPVYVPSGEVDDEEPEAGDSTSSATTQGVPQPQIGAKTQPDENELKRRQLLARIEELRTKQFPPKIEALKNSVLEKAKALGDANKFAEATPLLDQLAAKATVGPAAEVAQTSIERKGAINLGALKWNRWFVEKPLWPELLTKAAWDKNKSVLAKMTLSTGVGDQLKTCETAFQTALAKMPILKGANPTEISKSVKDCQTYMSDSSVRTLHDSLKALRDIAAKAAAESQKSMLIPKGTTQLCTDIANAADVLMVSCNPNSLSGFISEAAKTVEATTKARSEAALKRIEEIKAEKDLQKRIDLCEAFLQEDPNLLPYHDKVEDILAEARKQWGVDQAKAAYAAQMKGQAHTGDDKTPAYNPGNKFAPKNLQEKDKIFDNQKVKDLMRTTGLTEGEVLAIRAYTASNYKYINPAIANQKDRTDKPSDWMDIQNRPDPSKAKTPQEKRHLEADLKRYEEGLAKDKGSKKGLYEEGALHAGMMAEAFKKLPRKTGSLYRGARMTPKAFTDAYSKGKLITYEAFVSQSTSADVARGFANGGGDFAPPDDATTSVFVEAQITDGRDLTELSVYGAGEAEWLLPPGTKLIVESIQDDNKRGPGRPPAKEWKKVIPKQQPVK